MGCVALVSDGRDQRVKLRANTMKGKKGVFIAASNLIWRESSLRVSRVADRKPEKKPT